MRLLHVVPTYLPAWHHGGPIRAVHGLCKALAARGHEVTVFTTDVETDGAVPLEQAGGARRGRGLVLPGAAAPAALPVAPGLGRAAREEIPGFDAGPSPLRLPLAHHGGGARGRAGRRAVPRRPARHAGAGPAAAGAGAGASAPGCSPSSGGRSRAPPGSTPRPSSKPRRRPGSASRCRRSSSCRTGSIPSPGMARMRSRRRCAAVLAGGPFLLFLGRMSWKKGLDRLIPALTAVPGAVLAIAGNDEEGLRPGLEAGPPGRRTSSSSARSTAPTRPPSSTAAPPSSSPRTRRTSATWSSKPWPPAARSSSPPRSAWRTWCGRPGRDRGRGDLGEALRALLADPDRREAMGRRGAEAARGALRVGGRWRGDGGGVREAWSR